MTHSEKLEYIEQIMEYAQYEGSEFGEYLNLLCELGSRSDMMPKDFAEAYYKELKNSLEDLKENYEIYEDINGYKDLRLIGDE